MWDLLACPFDHQPLQGDADWLTCSDCGRGYPVLDGLPTFLPGEESPAWLAAQTDRVAALPDDWPAMPPDRSRAIRQRARTLEHLLRRHIDLDYGTRLLQVGLPRDAELLHFRGGERYGVEPLAGELNARGLLRWGQVRWVSGRGEELPFADGSFQAVLLGDVLASVESPAAVLEEAARCLAPEGLLWISCPVLPGSSRRTGRQADSRGGSTRLRDFTTSTLIRFSRRAGLKLRWSAWTDGLHAEEPAPPRREWLDPRTWWNCRQPRSRSFLFQPRRALSRAAWQPAIAAASV
ncbi:MAG: methyltransferase domain-containing protein [Pirellulales bacterium]